MRDLMILGIFLVLAPLALSNAFIAYLIWAWTAVVSIDSYTYGFMQSVRLNLIFSIIACCLILIGRDKERLPFRMSGTFVLLALFAIQATASNLFAYADNLQSSELYARLMKGLVFCLFMPMVVTRRYRIHCLVVVLLLGLGFHGVLEGLKVAVSGGGHKIAGLAKYGDNNQFALAMVISIPLAIYMYKSVADRSMRWISAAAIMLMLFCIVGTHSRGAFIGLVAIGLWTWFNAKKKLLGFLMIVICAASLLALAPDSWGERMSTIKEADQDTSFMTRVVAWKVSSAIALDHPLTGGGLRAAVIPSIWEHYRGSDGLLPFVQTDYWPETPFVAHSIYFEVLGDMGFVGLILFLALFANAFASYLKVRRVAQKVGASLQWARDLGDGLAGALFAFLIVGAALSMAYFEVVYILIVMMEVLKREVLRQTESHDTVARSFGSAP